MYTLEGKRYVLILLDDATNELTIHLLAKKSDTADIMGPYFEYAKNTGRPI